MPPELPRPISSDAEINAPEKAAFLLRTVVGEYQPLPESMNEKQMIDMLQEMDKKGYETADDVYRKNELVYRLNALQSQAAFEKRGESERVGLGMAKERETYASDMRLMLQHAASISKEATDLSKEIGVVPPDIQAMAMESAQFLEKLRLHVNRRTQMSNALRTWNALIGNSEDLAAIAEHEKALDVLKAIDPAGVAAFSQGDVRLLYLHVNALDEAIVDSMANDGTVLAKWLLALRSLAYRRSFDAENAHIMHALTPKENARWAELHRAQEAAERGQSEALDAAELQEFRQLNERRAAAERGADGLREDREAALNGILSTVNDLAQFHEDSLELNFMQKQFKANDIVTDAHLPEPGATLAARENQLSEILDGRMRFHRERLQLFVSRFDEQVLSQGLPEHVEDMSTKNVLPALRNTVSLFSGLFTYAIPEEMGLRDFARDQLDGPIHDVMGWPREKRDKSFEQLTPDEQQVIQERLRSVQDGIQEFDRSTIDNVYETMTVITLLPSSRTLAGETLPAAQDLPTDRVTQQNLRTLITIHGLPTVHAMTMRQIHDDIGDINGGGFLREVELFGQKMNANVGLHLDTARAANLLADRWMEIAKMILIIAGASLAAGFGASMAFGPSRRLGLRVAKGAGKLGFRAAPYAVAAYAGLKLASNYTRAMRLKELEKVQGVTAAMELLSLVQEKTSRPIARYEACQEALRNQRDAILIADGAKQWLAVLQERFPETNDERVPLLIEEAANIAKDADMLAEHFHRSFPLTDHLRTDPAGDAGNVGFNVRAVRNLEAMIQEGVEYERKMHPSLSLSAWEKAQSEGVPVVQPSWQEALQQVRTRYEEMDRSATSLLLSD